MIDVINPDESRKRLTEQYYTVEAQLLSFYDIFSLVCTPGLMIYANEDLAVPDNPIGVIVSIRFEARARNNWICDLAYYSNIWWRIEHLYTLSGKITIELCDLPTTNEWTKAKQIAEQFLETWP